MVTPWNANQRERVTGTPRSAPGTAVQVAQPILVRGGFERWLGLALWAGLLGVLLWMGAQ